MRHPIPGGAAWFHALGAVATFLLAVEFVTGLFLAFYYAPSGHTAWASVAFIQDELTAGWFVRGLHSFGASALIVVAALHLVQVLVWGAYRAPRELNWIVGVLLLVVVVAFCHDRLRAALGPEGLLGQAGRDQHRRLGAAGGRR